MAVGGDIIIRTHLYGEKLYSQGVLTVKTGGHFSELIMRNGYSFLKSFKNIYTCRT